MPSRIGVESCSAMIKRTDVAEADEISSSKNTACLTSAVLVLVLGT